MLCRSSAFRITLRLASTPTTIFVQQRVNPKRGLFGSFRAFALDSKIKHDAGEVCRKAAGPLRDDALQPQGAGMSEDPISPVRVLAEHERALGRTVRPTGAALAV